MSNLNPIIQRNEPSFSLFIFRNVAFDKVTYGAQVHRRIWGSELILDTRADERV